MYVPDAPASNMTVISPDYVSLTGEVFRYEGTRGNYNLEHQGKRFILMQCIGLLDRHGTEIYEGDVLQEDSEIPDCRGEVKFLDGAFRVRYYSKKADKGLGEYLVAERMSYKPVVLGNIYEHPELLKK